VVNRLLSNLIETFVSIYDAIASKLGHEDKQVYLELYRFNDVIYEEVGGWDLFPW